MRKRFVALVTVFALLTTLLSACSGKSTKPEDNKGGEQKEVVFHGAWAYDVPPKSHFNVFSTGNLTFPGGPYANLMTSPLALYVWHDNSWVKQLATEWKVDDASNTITVKLREGVKWSDGSVFKADDVMTYMWIGKAKNYTVWRYVDKVTKKGDYEVEFHLSNPASIALYYVLKMTPQPTSVYGEWAKKFETQYAAGKDNKSDEIKNLIKEFDAFRPAEYVASGPFIMDTKTITEAQVTMVKRPDAWNANDVKIDKIVVYNGETAAATPLVLDKKIDFVTHAFPPATEKQFLDMGLRIIRFPYYTGPAIFFNNNLYPFNRVEVRQAIAYAVDRTQAGTVALGKSGIGVKKMAGIADNMIDNWVNKDVAAKLNTYDYNPKKAEEILTSIGFKKGADGVWVDDKGKKMEYEFSVPSDFADWSAAADNVKEQLNKFGIKTSVRGTVWSQYTTDLNAGRFQFGFLPWGASTPHPQFAFLANMVNYNAGGKSGDAQNPGMNYPLQQKYSGGEIDFDKLITECGQGTDMQKQKDAVSKMVLAYNELLPNIPVFERYSNAPILDKTNVTGWPEDNDPLMVNGSGDSFATVLIVTGKLHGPSK